MQSAFAQDLFPKGRVLGWSTGSAELGGCRCGPGRSDMQREEDMESYEDRARGHGNAVVDCDTGDELLEVAGNEAECT